jgi:assimilatory nitrate reductase catalytic subunit
VPAKPGKSAVDLFKSLKTGEIKAVWIACTNPAQSLPNQAAVREALQAAEYVVLQEAYGNTDTADYADLLLPASGWGEKHGTVTNSERCITRVRPAVRRPARRATTGRSSSISPAVWAKKLDHAGVDRLFPYADAESIFNEHRETTRGRDLDITGLSYALLETRRAAAMALPGRCRLAGKVRLYEDGRFPTADGKARFVAVEHQPTADVPNPGVADQPALRPHARPLARHEPDRHRAAPVQPGRRTAARHASLRHAPSRNLESGDLARVSNARGEMIVRVAERAGLKKGGRAWMPMHWGSQFMNSPGANALACDAIDPYSMQPELKHAAVQIARVDLPYPLAVVRRCASRREALVLMHEAEPASPPFPMRRSVCTDASSPLVVFRAAPPGRSAPRAIAGLDRLFGLEGDDGAIVYADAGAASPRRRSPATAACSACGWPARPWPRPGSSRRWPRTNSMPR